MKFLTVFVAVIAVATATVPALSTWTLAELSHAVQDPATDEAILPYLQDALNTLMSYLFDGLQQTEIIVSVPVEETLTLEELMTAVSNPHTHPALLPYYEEALHTLLEALNNGQEQESVVLSVPALEVSVWTLQQLSEAVQSPDTDPALMVYLEYSLNELMSLIYSGHQIESIAVITPPGITASAPITETIIPEVLPAAPSPVAVDTETISAANPEIISPVAIPEVITPVASPEVATPVANPEVVTPVASPDIVVPEVTPVASELDALTSLAASPLVQIIVNINAEVAA